MPDFTPILVHAIPFTLVWFRLLGMFVFAPILSSLSIPTLPKVLLSVMLAAAMYPLVPARAPDPTHLDLAVLAPLIAGETMVGAAMGLIAAAPILFMQSAGFIMGHQMALNLSASYSPDDVSSDAIGQMLFSMAAATFMMVGGLEQLFLALAHTFRAAPAGSISLGEAPLPTLMAVLSSGTELALRLSLPVIGVLLLILICMSFVMKTMPQINIMSVGFTFKIISGLAVMAWSIYVIAEVAGDDIARGLNASIEWAASLGR